MATWRIGIDEHGIFDATNKDDNSFVCAVITQKSNKEIASVFNSIYANVFAKNGKAFPVDQKGNLSKDDQKKLLGFFHGCSQKKDVRESGFKEILQNSDDLYCHTVQCKEKPIIFANNQQWWTSAVLGVIKQICNLDFISKDDTLKFYIDCRDRICLGLLTNSNSGSKTINGEDPEWLTYQNEFKKALGKEIRQLFLGKVKVEIVSAKNKPIVALADQICGILKDPDFLCSLSEELKEKANAVQANVLNLTYGLNLEECIENGKFLDACDILIPQLFEGSYKNLDKLDEILNAVEDGDALAIWQRIFNACEVSLGNRGSDGKAIEHVARLFKILDQYEKDIPSLGLRVLYLKLHTALSAHSGNVSDAVHFNLEDVLSKDNCEYDRDTKRWDFYVEASAFQAQISFNAYDFRCTEIEKLVAIQDQLSAIKYPFNLATDDRVDENAAMLYGTIGQAAAFNGNLGKAALYFDRDYRVASKKTKSMPASYMISVCLRQENLDEVLAWFEKQSGMAFNEFGKTISKRTDQWIILSYFRIYALVLKKGVSDLPEFPAKDLWERSGNYPWPLLLKWAAYSKACLNQVEDAIDFLQTAQQELNNAPGFTVKSLALSPVAMLIQLRKDNKDEFDRYQLTYRNNLQRLCEMSPTFAKYVEGHPEITKAAEGEGSLWDAAMILPFNYS
ncbi:MAG: hypothetical protein HUK20_09805 [Fibrobacter sp.]|nr:hypothetical protein [Fibrobacter sp.]